MSALLPTVLRTMANATKREHEAETLRKAADEIDQLGARLAAETERMMHRARLDERLRNVNRKNWIEAAEQALAGDPRALQRRVDLSKAGPIDFTETDSHT